MDYLKNYLVPQWDRPLRSWPEEAFVITIPSVTGSFLVISFCQRQCRDRGSDKINWSSEVRVTIPRSLMNGSRVENLLPLTEN